MKVRILEYKRFFPDRNDYVCKWKHTADEPAILAVVPLLRTSQEAASWRRSLTHRRTGIVETTWCAQRTREEKKPYFGTLFWSREASMGNSRRFIILIVQFFNEKQFYHSSSKYLILFVCLIMCPIENNCMMVFFVSSTALQFCIHWAIVVVLWQHDNEDKLHSSSLKIFIRITPWRGTRRNVADIPTLFLWRSHPQDPVLATVHHPRVEQPPRSCCHSPISDLPRVQSNSFLLQPD